MKIQPLNKNILIAEIKQDNTTSSGIILEGNDNTKLGKVIEVGPEVSSVTEGDKIVLIWNKGHLLKVPGQQYVLINEDEVLAVIQ